MDAPVGIAPSGAEAPVGLKDLTARFSGQARALIEDAYAFGDAMHAGQKRLSGEAYFSHPVQVAGILNEMRLDAASIATALLHDVVEDTPASRDDLAARFGEEIAALVMGVTKLSKLELASDRTKQAENLQKFILAISQDVRVLLVKLADRLHNMQTLDFVRKPEKRERISRETLEIYAPLARRIGVQKMCAELEDLAFVHVHPAAFKTISTRLDGLRSQRAEEVSLVSFEISKQLFDAGLDARVFGREKRPYSIWRKLERKGASFEELADVYAFRVIVDNEADCYRALGVAHMAFRCVPERFRDWISTPKPNRYRSLHTTVMGPNHLRIELQIRTEAMEAVNEHGVAAHWLYKGAQYDGEAAALAKEDALASLRPLMEILEHGGDPDEFLEHAKLEMFADQVFCFSPKGMLIALPVGATPVDFAYAVHTDVGDTCVGARINGRMRPLRTRLQNGDVVEVSRGGAPAPTPDWDSLAVTGRARSAIRRLVRHTQREEFRRIGRALAERAVRREGVELQGLALTDALKRLGFSDTDALFEALGQGRVLSGEFYDAVYPGRRASQGGRPIQERELIQDDTARVFVHGRGLTPGVSLHFSRCCSPLPGDRIVGILEPDLGMRVHTIDCESLAEVEADQDRWVDLAWSPRAGKETASIGRVLANVAHEPGALADICHAVGRSGGNITDIRNLRRSPDFFDMRFDIEVRDSRHLSEVIAAMRACSCVTAADRARTDTR
ncbi:MAG: RelA/SpoT family protein [Maricaulaceae bacterium]